MDKLQQKLFRACEHLDRRKVFKAVQQGARLDVFDEYGDTPLGCTVKSWEGVMCNIRDKNEREAARCHFRDKATDIVQFLLEHGAQPDLCGGEYPDQPLVSAYWKENYEVIKLLLDAGADPNMNTSPENIGERSGILSAIDFQIGEDYGDFEISVEDLVRSHGGRLYWWDYDPTHHERIGKYYVLLNPTKNGLFWDNARYRIGTSDSLVVEDENDAQTTVKLNIPMLKEWHQQYLDNIDSPFRYDWNAWNIRGKEIAAIVAGQLPDKVSLFYPFEDEVTVRETWDKDGYYLDGPYEMVRIK